MHLPRFGLGVERHRAGADFSGELVDVLHRHPGGASLHADLRRPQLLRLHGLQRFDVAGKARVQPGRQLGFFQLGDDIAGQVLVSELPLAGGRLVDLVTQRFDHLVALEAHAASDVVKVQAAGFVQRHGQRIADGLDRPHNGLADRAAQQERGLHDFAGLVDDLELGHHRAVVVLAEQAPVLEDANLGLDLVAFFVGAGTGLDAEVVDRPVFLAEGVVCLVQRLESRLPVAVLNLCQPRGLHHVAHADVAFEPGHVLRRQLGAFDEGHTDAVLHPHQGAVLADVHHALALHRGVEVHLGRLALDLLAVGAQGRIDVLGQPLDGLGEPLVQLLRRGVVADHGVLGAAHAVAVDAPAEVVHVAADALLAEHHVWVGGEIFVDDSRAVLRFDGLHALPVRAGGLLPRRALAQEQHVRDHAGAGVVLEGRGRQADGAQQVGALGQVLARLVALLVHRALAGDEHQQATRAHAVQALGEEEVVQHEPELLVVRVAEDLGLRERRVAHRHVEVVARELPLDEVLVQHVLVG